MVSFSTGTHGAKLGVLDEGGSIIELTPTQVFKLFKKVADNDAWASSGRLQPLQAVGAAKSVLQVEREEVLEGKIDLLMRRLEKMEVEKKEAQAIDLKVPKQGLHVKNVESTAMSKIIARRKPRCSTT